jgi:hypothetical protein
VQAGELEEKPLVQYGKGGTIFDVVYLRNGSGSVKEMKPKVQVASRASFANLEKGGRHKVREYCRVAGRKMVYTI